MLEFQEKRLVEPLFRLKKIDLSHRKNDIYHTQGCVFLCLKRYPSGVGRMLLKGDYEIVCIPL